VDDSAIQRKVTKVMHEKLRGYELTAKTMEQLNFLYLSIADRSVVANLLEIQVQQMNEERKEVAHQSHLRNGAS
jgi:hypothetical protein